MCLNLVSFSECNTNLIWKVVKWFEALFWFSSPRPKMNQNRIYMNEKIRKLRSMLYLVSRCVLKIFSALAAFIDRKVVQTENVWVYAAAGWSSLQWHHNITLMIPDTRMVPSTDRKWTDGLLMGAGETRMEIEKDTKSVFCITGHL